MTDPLAAELAAIREDLELTSKLERTGGYMQPTMALKHGTALLAAVERVLKGHTDDPVFLLAGDCNHAEPPARSAEWDEWEPDHPPGAADVGRICLLTEIGRACPACTELVYGEEGPVGDEYVHATSCIVRPAVTAELLGEGKPDGK